MPYTDPVYVRFSGGTDICQGSNIFHQTEMFTSTDWVSIDVTFEVNSQLNYFLISASYGDLAPSN